MADELQQVQTQLEEASSWIEDLEEQLKDLPADAPAAAKQFLQQSILALRREKELLLLRLPPIQGARTITAEEIQNIVQDSLPTVSYDTLAKLRQSVFIVKESRTDKKGIGVSVFIGPKRAVTANHVLLPDQTRVYAAMPDIDNVLILSVVKRAEELDYAILTCKDEHDYLETYQGDPASLPGKHLALCTYSAGIAEDLNDQDLADNFAQGIGVMPASGVKLSEHSHFLVYTSEIWPGDSGWALVMHDGKLVGLHLHGVNHLKELLEHEVDDLPYRVHQLILSVKDVIHSVANGCVAVLASSFE